MNVNAQKFQSQYELVCKPSAQSNHRTTLPQSALAGCQLPQRGSREVAGAGTIQPGTRETGRVRAIFIAPTKTQNIWPPNNFPPQAQPNNYMLSIDNQMTI